MSLQSHAIRFHSQKIYDIHGTVFFNCESTRAFTDFQASFYDRKTPRPFDTIHDILRSLSLAQSLLEGQNEPIWRSGNQRI